MRIHYLAKRGDVEGVTAELAKGVPVDAPSETWCSSCLDEGDTPLIWAAKSRHAGVDMLELLIKKGADVNIVAGQFDHTPLMAAAGSGDAEKVRYLLEAGAGAKYTNGNNYTALMSGCPRTHEIIHLLIDAGTPLDPVTPWGESALSIASRVGDFEAVKILLDAGADPKPLEWTELMRAAALGTAEDVREALDKNPALNAEDGWGRNAWLVAVCSGNIEKARLLLDAGSSIEARGCRGKTPLVCAVEQDHADMLRWLLSLGLDIDMIDDSSRHTALIAASEDGSVECVRALVEDGADIQKKNHVSSQAINEAANATIAKLLIDAGAQIDHVDGCGDWLLALACRYGDIEFVRELLAMGASPLTDNIGSTALHEAAQQDELEIMRMLIDAGSDVNALHFENGPPLQCVRSIEGAKMLLDAGADAKMLYKAEMWPVWLGNEPEIEALVKDAGWVPRFRGR